MPAPALVAGLFGIGEKLIDHWFPNAEEAKKRKAELMVMVQQGKIKEMETAMSAIIAEANSSDKWTSRARPSFMYVMYIMILSAIPMGILSAFDPETAAAIATGLRNWLEAIPESMWGLFGVGYVGYAATRSYDKKNTP